MQLNIDHDSTINDVQIQFNAFYPYLKLQILKSIQTENKNSYLKKEIIESPTKKLQLTQTSVYISIENNVTVAQLVTSLKKIGLQAQVCRKSANQWVETSLTDDWTLERQNNEAMLLST